MGLVISVSNKLQKRYDGQEKQEDATVSEYLEETGEDWRAFVDGELKSSNENNNKTLGGCTTKPYCDDNDEDTKEYDVQMEKIMARFTNFNQMLSQNSGNDDDDDDDDEANDYEKNENFDEDDEEKKVDARDFDSDQGVKVEPVNLVVTEDLQQDYTDNSFWDIGKAKQDVEDIDYDSLLAELEWIQSWYSCKPILITKSRV